MLLVLSALTAFGPMSIDMYLPGLPSLATDLGVPASGAQLTLSAFFLGFGGGQLLYGPLGDRFGRQLPLLIGLGLFTAASVGCALATDLETLVLLRFIQALGGCAGPVLARAIVRDLYHADRAASVLSLMVLIMGAAPLFAPLIGGQLLLLWSWRAIFWLLAGFGTLCLVATAIVIGESLPAGQRSGSTLLGMILGYGQPLRHPRYIGYALSNALIYGGLFAYLTGSPLVFISLYGVPPQRYGLIFGANVIGLMLGATINSRIVSRFGVDRLLAQGVLAAAVSGSALAAVAATGAGGLPALLVPLFFYIASIGFVGANAIAGCLRLFPERAATASALAGTLQFLIGAISGSLIGALGNETALPMAGVIMLAGLCGLVVQRTLAPSRSVARP